MVARPTDLYIEQGATFRRSFIYTAVASYDDAGNPVAGDPIDISAWTLRMQIRKKQGAPILAEATSSGDSPDIVIGPDLGAFVITLPEVQTNGLTSASCLYDLEGVDGAGNVVRIIQGVVTVSPNITQADGDPVVR